ncbi:hypothetical protein GZ77_17830 [Endozoicomonas montiporae]|uniref:Uncharacterized protein n=2 Tax=Endozoicomonas montiporae TaxID=1027273 RepID=A0A081N1S5_9GAMM|nr:hypothetical protein [Endozoicomonas montiporae]AMO58660.1 hypothetical protein EZMO1_4759 [Endozoicomonas montiporae CL-33]KEQ12398.1 hypothetical protein GZ77_17830 [Endozoicomonas montiporae]
MSSDSHNKEKQLMDTYQKSLARLLIQYNDLPDSQPLRELVAAAQSGFTQGANEFVDQALQSIEPGEMKDYLRTYPLAQILMGIIKFHELNHDTQVIRNVVETLLDSIEEQDRNITLH